MKYKILIIATVAISLAACTNPTQTAPSNVEVPVYIMEITRGPISRLINNNGTALPSFNVDLNSEMSGLYKIQINPRTGKPFKMGDRVNKDQVIICLEDKSFENSIAIDTKKLNLEIAEQELASQKRLLDLGGSTPIDIRNAEVKVTNTRYDLENATINLEKRFIKAPFDGIIVSLPHYPVDVKVDQNKPMVGIMGYSNMYMEVNFAESKLKYIQAGQPVQISHHTLPNDTLSGVISELSPAISTETRTFKTKILINNSDLKLHPGMFVAANVVVDTDESSIVIPKNVILSNRNRKYVFVVERGIAVTRAIITGIENEDEAQIIDGLYESDNLIIRGFETLRENSRVKVLQ